MTIIKTHHRACHLCEAICGLEIKTENENIISIKGDKEDPISKGYICPKATAIADIHNDPDRLRQPVKRVGEEWQTISWDEAIELTAQKLIASEREHGDDSIAFFAGNPAVHNYGNLTHGTALRRVFNTKNHYSATSLDQLPHQLAALKMYGHQFMLPIPDIDQTDFMLILGGNPLASNGSIMTVPNVKQRLNNIQQRGGKFVVIDPRRTETADMANEHYFIRPGTDATLLLAIINVLFTNDLVNTGHLTTHLKNVDALKKSISPFSLKLAAQHTGIDEQTIKQLAKSLANTPKAVVYGRMGVSVQEFGGICQWAIQVINILIGALDAIGGALLTSPAYAYVEANTPAAGHFDLYRSRVSSLPEFSGELPAIALAEEMLTTGEGQIKAMITIAGNPLISSANVNDLTRAFEGLDFYVAFDFYINATTCHADVILPPTSPLEHDHYDIAFLRLAVRNSTRYNPAVFASASDTLHDWQIYNLLAAKISELKDQDFRPLPSPDLIISQGIEHGFFGEKNNPEMALTLDKIKQLPHGLDLGALTPSITKRIATKDGLIDIAPDIYLLDLPRLIKSINASVDNTADDEFLLIGRRHVRSNNSWMHNYHRLVKGKPRWQLLMHPDDLAKQNIDSESQVTIKSRVGSVTTTVIASDEIMPGVVSLPHGWGHNKKGVKMNIAKKQKGVNCNTLTDDKFFDALSGNAALNGVTVQVLSS